MRAVYTLQPRIVKIDYIHDTLFGVNAFSAECQVQIAMVQINGFPGVQLQITPPLPQRIERAHTLVFDWQGRTCRGIVQSSRRCDDGGLQLRLELQ